LSARFGAGEPLAPQHNVDRFECGREQLSRWLHAYAGQGQRRDTARTFVVCRQGEIDVVGYYTLVASQVEQGEATGEVQRGTAPSKVLA
jgi:homoserine acetyltransferase